MRHLTRPITLGLLCGAVLTAGCGAHKDASGGGGGGGATSSAGKTVNVYLLPKQKGIAYFTSCSVGAEAAAKELGDVNLVYDGPTDGAPEAAASLIESWTLKGANVICVSPNDPNVLAPAMTKAKQGGVHMLTWDADSTPDSREFFVDQATSEQIGDALVDTMAKDIGGADPVGKVAIVTATLTAANQNEWIKFMQERLKKYPRLQLVAIKPCNDNQTLAFQVTQDLMKAYPDLKGVFGISSVAFPGAAEAIKQAGKSGQVLVTGLSTPNNMKPYVKDGTVKSVVLWNTEDLGYLTIYAAEAVANGKLKPGATTFHAGKLGDKKIEGDKILLGDILVFNKDNIDKFNF
ncbi:rhamnose ABC transporter substrate-binding protein [Capsulimonas corticalis]|uniref:Autoinducer 2-binding protein LsrB n=1 Tax=Capsulimonas corticalis TaxID=2219043 RepID=A0A402D438_9BACT|nr:substrate-binding domain-containing protein [Capsulimonas corticalis]BDI31198.1 rhamnose ABC transporter substrate-binding protein [Capsulimonas corticalis]